MYSGSLETQHFELSLFEFKENFARYIMKSLLCPVNYLIQYSSGILI